MFSKIMVVNMVCHSFHCGQSYVISIYAKINLSLQLVCNHGNYSVTESCFCSVSDNLAEINCASCTVKWSHAELSICGEHLVVDLYFLSVTPFSSAMWDDQWDHRVYEVTEVQWPLSMPNVTFCWHHTGQSVSASVERVGKEKVGGVTHRVTWTWWLLWLAVGTGWSNSCLGCTNRLLSPCRGFISGSQGDLGSERAFAGREC